MGQLQSFQAIFHCILHGSDYRVIMSLFKQAFYYALNGLDWQMENE